MKPDLPQLSKTAQSADSRHDVGDTFCSPTAANGVTGFKQGEECGEEGGGGGGEGGEVGWG